MLEMSVLTEAEDLNAIIDHFRGDERFTQIFLWGPARAGSYPPMSRLRGRRTWRP